MKYADVQKLPIYEKISATYEAEKLADYDATYDGTTSVRAPLLNALSDALNLLASISEDAPRWAHSYCKQCGGDLDGDHEDLCSACYKNG